MDTSDDPITIAIIAVSVSGGLQIISTIEQGKAAEAQGKFQEQIAIRNAEQALREAEGKRQAAAEAAIEKEREGRRAKGRTIAALAKSGVDPFSGSSLANLVEIAEDIEADRLTILREGAIGASTDVFRAGILKAQGSAAKQRGKAAKRASVLSSIGTAAGTVGSVAGLSSLRTPNTTIPSRAGFGI